MSPLLPRSRGSQIYLLLLLGVAVGLVLVVAGPWRTGVVVVGASFLIGAVARVVVPPAHTGMLRVRGKTFDIAWTGVLGVSLVLLALVVPEQPPL